MTVDAAPLDATRDGAATVEAAVASLVEQLGREPDRRRLLEARFDAGLAWVENPVGLGGLGIDGAFQDLAEQLLFDHGLLQSADQRAAQHAVFGPMLMRHGTPDQQDRYLRPLFAEAERWCQLFSEPDAGSDLAGARTSARRDGDQWVIDGQKVWTTMAHRSDRGLLLARSDRDAQKHAGLTAFIVDMHQPGVEVRPLRQLTGDAEFNEVFLRGAVVPDADRIGNEGDGWAVIKDALANERRSIGHESTMRGEGPIREVLDAWTASGSVDPVRRDEVAQLWIRAEVTRLLAHRVAESGGAISPLLTKLAFTSFLRDAYEAIVDIMGADGLLFPDAYEFRMHDDHTVEGHDPRWNFLGTRGRTIGGGTSEVLRNTVGERVLGLPREPRG